LIRTGAAGGAEAPTVSVTLDVNGTPYPLTLDARTTPLDALREHIGLAKRVRDYPIRPDKLLEA
jgi:hypothetical protein